MDTVKKTFCRVTMLVICLLLAITLATSAKADVTYTYTGNFFQSFYNNDPNYNSNSSNEINVLGEFTLATALAPNSSYSYYSGLTPLTFTFTDGTNVWSPTDAQILQLDVSTDSSGDISPAWNILLSTGTNADGLVITTYRQQSGAMGGYAYDEVYKVVAGTPLWGASNGYDPGTWTVAVPEPSTMLLLGSGVVGLLGFRRKFKK